MRGDREPAFLRANLRPGGGGVFAMKMEAPKTIAIGDLYIPSEVMREAIELLSPSHLTTMEWKAADEAELQARLLLVEKRGPDAVEPPPEIWEHLEDTEFLM